MSSINVKPTLKLDTSQSMPPPPNGDNPKPKLKLNTATPSREKIKINLKEKLGGSQPGTPAATSAAPTPSTTKSKAGRTSKPTKKLLESKKRGFDSDDEDRPLSETRQESARPSKMIKIKHNHSHSQGHSIPPTPINSIKFKPRGEPIEHHPGDGYDSEASDREADPIRESTFVIRTLPDPSMDYLKKALEEGTVGVPKQMGGADFSVQFIDAKTRRAVVTIDGNHYAAVLVQLPTITEATKTWDKRNMMKNSDISEMLLCFKKVNSEAEAKIVPIPEMVSKNDFKWPHGLTPPLHDAPHRRFRKTLSEKQWQNSAARVLQLLEEDETALDVQVEVIRDDDDSEEEEDEEDAEGEIEQDYFGGQPDAMEDDMEEDDELLAAMEAALEDAIPVEEPVTATPNVPLEAPEAPTPMTIDAITPAPIADEVMSEEDEDEDDEEDEEDDDDDDDDEEEVDEEQLVAERERQEKLDEIEHLNKAYEDTLRQLAEVNAPILKRRILTTKDNLEKEIAVKKAALGLTDED
ncbi:TAFII55 protein conserved region-domain-containing protein [Annulohypoxylon maeteangense]|uniref:TAFII55 protein conserved region-domain-containing protein n=1 Tax=Annulohypoxylon maeteangense TaxID=1927788 RepID=UPI0020080C1D|nr:TAFII55 protein conserved region-domain-containing protein [Annulohypoxylon maeteangense]KAI0890650.1 TAFII55 protein conserved region-domain-containing protein [Annulohypoxylon maeteangense]